MRRMKRISFYSIVIAVLALAMFPATALAAPLNAVVVGNNYTLQSGQTLKEDLFVVGGNVDLMSGSTVDGSIYIIGGNITAAGTVNGNMIVLGGTVSLTDTFILNGNLTSGGATINRSPGAQINGQIHVNENTPTVVIPGQVQINNVKVNPSPILKVVGFFLSLFLWVLVAMLVAMFIPNHLARTAHTALTQPVISWGLGLVTAIIVPILSVLLIFTIFLIPVSLAAILVLVIAWFFGMISLGYEVGKRISSTSKVAWHPALAAGLGTLLLMIVLNGIDALVPCVGWIPKILVGLFGLGAVLLTQFGMKDYNPTPSAPTSGSTNSLPPTST